MALQLIRRRLGYVTFSKEFDFNVEIITRNGREKKTTPGYNNLPWQKVSPRK